MRQFLSWLGMAALATILSPSGIASQNGYSAASKSTTETRRYDINIDGKPAGNYTLVISLLPDGGVNVQSQASVRKRVLIFSYSYDYRGHEVWKNDHLTALESHSQEDGKPSDIAIAADSEGLKVKVNSRKQSITSLDTLPSSYWHLVGQDKPSHKFVEVDSGRVFTANLQAVGDERLKTADGYENCHHFKLTGGDTADLWYDTTGRLVRQTSVDDGHHTEVMLKSRT